jgi:hypothetical protein
MTSPRDRLPSLSRGFRSSYLRFDDIAAQLRAWADAFPEVCEVRAIGKSVDGRELLLLVIGRDRDRAKPSVWVDGNMHAQELCGSSVALAIAEDVLALHLDPSSSVRELPSHVASILRDVTFFVLPRMCPDGAEAVLTTGRYVRSNPRDRRVERKAHWRAGDIDGDGVAYVMRKRDAIGEMVEAKDARGMMVPRELEDEGPFYKLYPEGRIEHFDGTTIPEADFLCDNDTDLNRNFPFSWMPEPEQAGAGSYAASEPETRAVVDFTTSHPEIFAWLNLHTFGGVYIRPLGNKSDKQMNQQDLALYRQLEAWGQTYGGYPTVSGFEEFLYAPDKPLYGDLTDYAYHQRGAVGIVCELWDLFHQLGIPRKKPFVDHYTHMTRDEITRIAAWDREHNEGRAILPWKTFSHPQIGEVEIGGVDTRVGLVNPPLSKLGEVCERQTAFFLRVAALAPRLEVRHSLAKHGDVTSIEVTVTNTGYLPTFVLASAKALPWNEPVRVEAEARGVSLLDESDAVRELGHLDGWGRGLYSGEGGPTLPRTRGSVSTKTVRYQARGHGTLRLRAGSARTGFVEHVIEIG